MDDLVKTYVGYLAVAVPLTVWVGRTLSHHGRVFLVDVFDGDDDLAEAVNKLLTVGFYLVNLGYVLLALRIGHPVADGAAALEALSVKLGAVTLVLGAVHLTNLYVLNRMRRRAQDSHRFAQHAVPPVAPDARISTNPFLPA